MTTNNYLLVPVYDDMKVLPVEPGKSLEVLQGAVEGYVQCIQLGPKLNMWMNEEGKLTGMEPNLRAQLVFDAAFGRGADTVVGPVVLTGGVDRHGNTLGLTAEDLAAWRDLVGQKE